MVASAMYPASAGITNATLKPLSSSRSILRSSSPPWIMMGNMAEALERMHQDVLQRIARRRPMLNRITGTWSYSLTAKVLEMAGLIPLVDSPENRQMRMADYVATRLILVLFLDAMRTEGVRVSCW